MTRRERKEQRAERLREWARKRESQAGAVLKQTERFRGDTAFNTQPGHIPFRARIIGQEDRAHESLEKAKRMKERARGIEIQNQNTIFSDDPDAPDRLREKIQKLEKSQEEFKKVNIIIRKNAKAGAEVQVQALVSAGLGLSELVAQKLLKPDFMGRVGIPGYVLTNNNANIRRLKSRLKQIENEAVNGKPWRYLIVKYAGPCCVCGQVVNPGDSAYYRRPEIRHLNCEPGEGENP